MDQVIIHSPHGEHTHLAVVVGQQYVTVCRRSWGVSSTPPSEHPEPTCRTCQVHQGVRSRKSANDPVAMISRGLNWLEASLRQRLKPSLSYKPVGRTYEEVADWADHHFAADWLASLTETDVKTLHRYSYDADFSDINSVLRRGENVTTHGWYGPIAAVLDKAIACGHMDQHCTLYRSFHDRQLCQRFQSLPGHIVQNAGYVSTSLLEEVADDFYFNPRPMNALMLVIHLPAGHPCAFLDKVPGIHGELEVLLAKGTDFRVERVKQHKEKRYVYVTPEPKS